MSRQVQQRSFNVDQASWCGQFPMLRGGVATFSLRPTEDFFISVRADPGYPSLCDQDSESWVGVLVSKESAKVIIGGNESSQTLHSAEVITHAAHVEGWHSNRWLGYWVSFDPDSCTLKYGIGHHMEETTALVYCLPEELRSLYRAAPKLVCLHGYASGPIEPRSVFEAKLRALEGYESATVEFDRCPLITNPPPLIMDSSKLTLMDLGERQILASSDLPPACQVLYQHLSQPCISLDWGLNEDTCLLTDAIRHSLATPGALLYTRCKEKAAACGNGVPPKQSYLRVSVGLQCGRSPGVPYVLELWPPGHFSPVHNHGNAFGIVRILHGSITTRIFNRHLSTGGPLQEMVMKKGDLTWFSPNWYQTHQLENHTDDFCCTVQGFQYADDDDVHWPYMQFRGPTGRLTDFLPVSDFTFADLRERVLAEYAASLAEQSEAQLPRLLRADTAMSREGRGASHDALGILAEQPEHVTGVDVPQVRCQARSRVIEITASSVNANSCRRTFERQLTPDSPLEVAAALANLSMSPTESLPDSRPQPQRPVDVVTLL